jgi:hypothetical protein
MRTRRLPSRSAARPPSRRKPPHDVYVFPTGHSPFDVDEKVRQIDKILDFLGWQVPGLRTAA